MTSSLISSIRKILNDESTNQIFDSLKTLIIDSTIGGVTFFHGLLIAQIAQKSLKISASSYPFSSLFGCVAVMSSSALSMAFVAERNFLIHDNKLGLSTEEYFRIFRNQTPVQTVSYALGGIILFRLLGGRFYAIAPSDLRNLGAFHMRKASLPATVEYANQSERAIINEFGRLFGCHSCGNKKTTFHADHMPPIKFIKKVRNGLLRFIIGKTNLEQRFYPQCKKCSSIQGNIVKKNVKYLQTHYSSFRSYHTSGFWLTILCSSLYPITNQPSSTTVNKNESKPTLVHAMTNRVTQSMYPSMLERERNLEKQLRQELKDTKISHIRKKEIEKDMKKIEDRKVYLKKKIRQSSN